MRLFWKIAVPLLLVLPIAAYVAGTLADVDDRSEPRETIIIQDSGGQDPAEDNRGRRGTKDGDDREEIRREGDDDSDDAVEVVEPEPDDVTRTRTGRDHADDGGDDGGDDDDDGSGSGDDRDDD